MKYQNQCYMIKSPLETDIFNYKTPEFFINMKDIPDKKSEERRAFVLEEKRKCIDGVNINGIFIPGGLYFHLNYYHLEGDDIKTGKKRVMLPRLRDNEWVIFNDYDQCAKLKKIYLLFGARQISKSETETSLCLRELSLFKQTEALALFSGQPDKDTFVKKISTAITHGEKFIIIPNIDKDWSKDEIRFGLTKIDNTTDLRARLYIYNTQEGKKIQVGSGKSVSFLLLDEIAKSPFRSVYDTIEPALLSDIGGLRCAPILAFTGGETEKAKDAKNIIENPNKENQFTTIMDDGKEIGGRFMSGLYRKDCKYETTMSEYLGKKTDTWLDNYPIFVSDFDAAKVKIDKEKEEALKSPDSNTFLLKRIFFPLNLDDVFLTEENNKFNKEAISQQQTFLKEKYEPVIIDLFRDLQGNVQWKSSNKKLINKFPISPSDNKEAGCLMIEPPIKDAPRFTYVIGIDPIHHNDSEAREVSLASITVYKRMLSPFDEFKNQIVFTYRGRPSTIEEFHELSLMIAEFYNAVGTVIPEASEQSIFQYFRLKKKGHYLADTFDLIKDMNKGFNRNASKGLPPTTVNQRHYMNLMVEEVNDTVIDLDEEGNETVIQGASRIYDYMLLEELKNYKSYKNGRGVHNGNYDSIVSFGVALSLAKHLDIVRPLINSRKNFYDSESNYVKDYTKTMFGAIKKGNNGVSSNTFSQNPVKLPSWIKR